MLEFNVLNNNPFADVVLMHPYVFCLCMKQRILCTLDATAVIVVHISCCSILIMFVFSSYLLGQPLSLSPRFDKNSLTSNTICLDKTSQERDKRNCVFCFHCSTCLSMIHHISGPICICVPFQSYWHILPVENSVIESATNVL